MANSVLTLITNASRPFKEFETELGGEKVKLFTRRLSAAESSNLQKVYSDEVGKVREALDKDSGDLTALKHSFSKQTKEKLIRFVVEADRADYISEAASELDDAEIGDPKVTKLAEVKMEDAKLLMENAEFTEILDMAIDRRAYVITASRASQVQNRYLLHYLIYTTDDEGNKVKVFPSETYVEEELDNSTIDQLLMAAFKAMDTTEDSPLKSAPKTQSRKRTVSQSHSAEE